MRKEKPILVSGSHRSGSTWVGKMISLSKDVGYIHEPLLYTNLFSLCNGTFSYFYPYISEKNNDLFSKNIEKSLDFKINIIKPLIHHAKNKELDYFIKYVIDIWRSRLLNKRPLLKDPLAFFSVEWLYKEFNCVSILIIRHPAAFVASVIKQNWGQHFDHFLNQTGFVEEQLSPFQDQILEYSKKQYPLIDQAILIWNIVHYQMHNYMKNYPQWYFVKHEDLSLDPIGEFSKIYDFCNLDFTDYVKDKIIAYSGLSDKKVIFDKKVKLDSKKNITAWKKRLSTEEIKYIYDNVEEYSKVFYNGNDW